jgi:signal transduction histidine kinase
VLRSIVMTRPSEDRVWYAVMLAAWLSLPPLAWLQYTWIGRISLAERERLQTDLTASVSRFAGDVDSQVDRIARGMQVGPGSGPPASDAADLQARLARLSDTGADDRLIGHLYATRGGANGTDECLEFNRTSGELTKVDWPAALEPLRQAAPHPTPDFDQPRRGFPFNRVDDQFPALFVPWYRPPPDGSGPMRGGGVPPPPIGGWLIVQLDLDYLKTVLLPSLAQEHFARGGRLEYDVQVVSAGEPRRVIYSSAAAAEPFAAPDAQAAILGMRRGPPGAMPGGPPGIAPDRPPDMPLRGGEPSSRGLPPEPRGGWIVQVVHRGGSLDALVRQTRQRNLGISLGVLAVLAASLATLFVSTRRAQRLALLQMDFVAGVSHELRTPLSVIRSAGENLADGLVSGSEQVRRYGGVIRDEGRRLSQMVEQILGFAGLQSGRTAFDFQPVDVREVIARAIQACEPEIRASGCTVETDISADLPGVVADATSLVHCLRNLIDNAVTHGGEGKWVGVSARKVDSGKQAQLEIRVEDRGRGIDPEDARRVFDPFYRGRRSVRDQIKGFGLGLALARRIVDAHSGTLWAEPIAGGGARFLIRLPAAPGAAAAAGEAAGSEDEDDGEADSAGRG